MSPAEWQHRLDQADTKEGVVAVVNDFLALWSIEDLGQLPTGFEPGTFNNSEQVKSYALKLARRHTIGVGEMSTMHRMATFFTKAALRIFKINEDFSEDAERRESGRGGS